MVESAIYCSKCGARNSATAVYCQRCGAVMGTGVPATAAPVAAAPVAYAPAVVAHGYGGFWIRFVAFVVDGIIVRLVTIPLAIALGAMGIIHRASHWGRIETPEEAIRVLSTALAIVPIFLAVNWLYEALLTSSEWQATLGKKMLNLRVTDEAGNRISFARATGRHFAKYISGILFIGYIMAAFTDRKRALHDMLAGTLVRKG
jgi:uncharacterized RDD family membrane protein YckC